MVKKAFFKYFSATG